MNALQQTKCGTEDHVSGRIRLQRQEHFGGVAGFAVTGEVPVEACREQHIEKKLFPNHGVTMLTQPAIQSPLDELEWVLFGGNPITWISDVGLNQRACQTGGSCLALP